MYKLIARLMGWQISAELPEDVRKVVDRAVLVAAPHTSNWDAFWIIVAAKIMKIPLRFGIKREWLKTPLAPVLRWGGAIGIDRRPKGAEGRIRSQVDAMISLFERYPKLTLALAPEGTRRKAERWKTGFYQVAVQAGVPLVLSHLDYKKKVAAIDRVLYPTGDMAADFRVIAEYYADKTPRHPQRFSLDMSHEHTAKKAG